MASLIASASPAFDVGLPSTGTRIRWYMLGLLWVGPAKVCGYAMQTIIRPAGLRRQSSNPETATAMRLSTVVKFRCQS